MKSEKYRGTFGGSRAGDRLDELLCEINDPKLISKVSKVINAWGNKKAKIIIHVRDAELFQEILKIFMERFVDKINKLSLSEFNISLTHYNLIKSLSCNVIVTGYRAAIQNGAIAEWHKGAK